MSFKQKIILCALAIMILGAAGAYSYLFSNLSTHTSLIRIAAPEGPVNKERRIADFDQIVTLADAWAPSAGFAKVVPDAAKPMRQSWFSTGDKGNQKTVYYLEQSPRNRSFPTEIMMVVDPDNTLEIQISTTEGYYKKPTATLQKVHSDLERILKEHFPDRVIARIW